MDHVKTTIKNPKLSNLNELSEKKLELNNKNINKKINKINKINIEATRINYSFYLNIILFVLFIFFCIFFLSNCKEGIFKVENPTVEGINYSTINN